LAEADINVAVASFKTNARIRANGQVAVALVKIKKRFAANGHVADAVGKTEERLISKGVIEGVVGAIDVSKRLKPDGGIDSQLRESRSRQSAYHAPQGLITQRSVAAGDGVACQRTEADSGVRTNVKKKLSRGPPRQRRYYRFRW
jgi:hypothetical protein